MPNKISRKTMLKIYDLSLKLHKNKGPSPYKIVEVLDKKFGISPCVRTIYWWINQGRVPLQPEPPKNSLYDLYSREKLSMKQIADKLKIGKTSVKRYLKRYKIKPYIIPSMERKIGLEIQKVISPFFEVCQVR